MSYLVAKNLTNHCLLVMDIKFILCRLSILLNAMLMQ